MEQKEDKKAVKQELEEKDLEQATGGFGGKAYYQQTPLTSSDGYQPVEGRWNN